jgi:NAD-dependent deacetylase
MNKIEKLQEILYASDNIVFFGGAGVSTESGIPDFRSESGIFKSLEKYGDTPERLVSHSYYLEHTEEFFSYYKDCLIFPEAEPNSAHYTLARLEKEGKLKAIITQNIDGLHKKAGSKNVLELHGSVYRNYCEICKKEYNLDFILESEGILHCTCGGIIKPDVVLYEEALDMNILNKSAQLKPKASLWIMQATLLLM